MTDIQLFQGPDGGDVEVTNGVLTLDGSPSTAVYLSLFGGNVEDDGTTSKEAEQWWANRIEAEPTRRYRSQTQALLVGLPAIPANTKRIEEANLADLAWLTENLAKSVTSSVTIPARNTARIVITVIGHDGVKQVYDFTKPWGRRTNA
jgi:phage gp46-like protein